MDQAPSLGDLSERLRRFSRPGVPKYVALYDAVANAVTGDEWPAGVRLPNEAEMASALPLSLGTIQRALRLLVQNGVVVRRQGQGTFLTESSAGRMNAPMHLRFVDDSGNDYLPVYPRVTARARVTAKGAWSGHLRVAEVLCVERVIAIGDEFKVFSRYYVDPARFPSFETLSARKLSGKNFKEVIWRESAQPVGRISQFLSAVALPDAVCKETGVKRGAPGQRVEIFAFAGLDDPIYYQELFIPPNRRRLHIVSDGRASGLEQG